MRLDPAAFNAHLAWMGQSVLWARGYRCPCTSPASGASAPNCPHCHGKGYTWGTPQASVCGLSGLKVQRTWNEFGLAEIGDVVLTVPSNTPLYAAGSYDKIILSNSSEAFSTTITHGTYDRLPWPLVSIDRCFWYSGGQVVEGGVPAFDANGALTWASGAPPVGREYSISGRYRPEYFVYQDFPQDRAHHSGLPLPRRIVARKLDLLGR